jgi:RimJ/RimL family protein N-acetyltransferase
MEQLAFSVSDRFDPAIMQEFMRRPDVYWDVRDALAPQPESVDFVSHMLHPDVWTVAAKLGEHIVGYIQFNRRTSVMAEMTVAFHPQARGRVARTFVQIALQVAFTEKGLLKVLACIPDDNRAAIYGVRHLGFTPEGRLRNAIVRKGRTPPLADLLLFGLSRQGVN